MVALPNNKEGDNLWNRQNSGFLSLGIRGESLETII